MSEAKEGHHVFVKYFLYGFSHAADRAYHLEEVVGNKNSVENYLFDKTFRHRLFSLFARFSLHLFSLVRLAWFASFLLLLLLAFGEAQFQPHFDPECRKQKSEYKLDEADGPHDEFFVVVEEDEVRLLNFGIVFDHDQPEHQSAYNVRNRPRSFPDFLNELWSNWQRVGNAQEWAFVVLQIVVPLYLFFNLRIVVLQLDQFVSPRRPAHVEHNRVSSICSQVGENRMPGEVDILEAYDLAIVWGDFNR